MTITTTATVVGMTCDHCARAVSEAVGQIAGVVGVDVDLGSGLVSIDSSSEIVDGDLRVAIEDAGYEVTS